MRDKLRFSLALGAAWGSVLVVVGATVLLVGADLDDQERALLAPVLKEHAASVILIAALLILPLALVLKALFRRYVSAPRQLAEDARIMLTANPSHRAPARGSAEIKRLAGDFNRFADAHELLQQDVECRVREANAHIEQERNRLAALMSELAQSVIMCNIEGRILLYNSRAMQ
jgi:DNA polymerase-3 subunit epsilon